MDNQYYQNREMEIDLKFVMWRILSQWKAVLLVAFAMALIVTGIKYFRDMGAYKSAEKDIQTMKKVAGLTAEERIAEIMSELSEDERATVEFVLEQQEWIDREMKYINNSILLNSDPENQRRLRLKYCVEVDVSKRSNLEPLIYSYEECLKSKKSIDILKKAFDIETDDRYIAELIGTGDSGTGDSGTGDSDNVNIIVFLVNVVLPEAADVDAIEQAITTSIKDYEQILSNDIATHSIRLISSEESFVYNSTVADKRTSLINSINNLNNSVRNIMNNLSTEQKDAVKKINEIKDEGQIASDLDAQDEAVSVEAIKPTLSMKYILLGFILGCCAYAAVYLAWLILRRRINTASDIENITGVRLIGEVYEIGKRSGLLSKLLHSTAVDMLQYKGKLNADKQIEKLVTSIGVICEHENINNLTIFNMAQDTKIGLINEFVLEKIIASLKKKGIKVKCLVIDSETGDKDIADAKNAILMADNSTSTSLLWRVMSISNAYGVKVFGNLFASEI